MSMPYNRHGTPNLGLSPIPLLAHPVHVQSKDWYDEEAVGAGLAASRVPRDQLFLTSKIHPRDLGYNQTMEAFQRALQHLRTTYLDLLLLHYPTCFPSANCIPQVYHSWQRSWQALEDLVGQGKVRSIGKAWVQGRRGAYMHCAQNSVAAGKLKSAGVPGVYVLLQTKGVTPAAALQFSGLAPIGQPQCCVHSC